MSASPPVPHSAAFFDVDGTLLASNIVSYYVHLMTDGLSRARRAMWLGRFALWVPVFCALDWVNRSAFNRFFYTFYRGVSAEGVRKRALESFHTFARPRLFPDALRTIRQHQAAGHMTALVTGTTSFIAQPLADYLDIPHVLAVELEEANGRFTGRLLSPPLSGARKADAVVEFAERRGIDLARSYAYGDSVADLPMLHAVGCPVAVNPSRRLARIAARLDWPVRRWRPSESEQVGPLA